MIYPNCFNKQSENPKKVRIDYANCFTPAMFHRSYGAIGCIKMYTSWLIVFFQLARFIV